MLEHFQVPLSAENVTAMTSLMQERGQLFRELFRRGASFPVDSEESPEEELQNAAEELLDSLENREEARKGYQKLVSAASETLEAAMDSPDLTAIDLRRIHAMNKQLSLVSRLSNEENYEVPMEIGGRITSVNLKVIHGTGEAGADITMDLEGIGGIRVNLKALRGEIGGGLAAAWPVGTDFLKERLGAFRSRLEEAGLSAGALNVTLSRELNINRVPGQAETAGETEEAQASARVLYRAAKAFLESLRDAA